MKEHIFKIILLFVGAATLMVACRPKADAVIEPQKTTVVHADWTRNMVL